MSENNNRKNRSFGPPRNNVPEKSKNFKGAMLRLFKELKNFRLVIYIALILAIAGSILSISAPNRLSELTDEISAGIIINTDNLEHITSTITSNLDEEILKTKLASLMEVNITDELMYSIMLNDDISSEDLQAFQLVITNISSGTLDENEILQELLTLPDSILELLFEDITYNNIQISSADRISFLNTITALDMSDISNINIETIKSIPESIQSVLFPAFDLDGITISSAEQIEFISLMSNIDDTTNTTALYSALDEAPESIRQLIEPSMNMSAINKIAIFLLIIYLCSALFTFIESICMTDVANKFAKKLRSRISTKINKLPLKYFDKNSTGDILSRVTNDVDTIAQTMNQSLATLVSSITLFVGTIIMMFYTNWIMALTAIISSLIGFIAMFMILGKSQKYFVSRQEELGKLNGHIEEVYSGLNVVKVYNGKKQSDKTFDELNKKVYNCNWKSQFLSGLMQPIMNFIGNFGYVAVCIVGALLTMNDMISFGVIVAFITYVRLFTSPLSQIAQAMTSLQSTAAASERVFEFLDEEEMPSQDKISKKLDKDKVKGRIEFENVVFKYDGNDKPTIKNFSATALPGQKIAIVGPTGAGKTTLVNLLMKFYDISQGTIKIDGVPISELSRENIHELFTMVLQDTWLFNGTIKENIVYNRKNVSDERVKQVCDTVGISHFIRTLPKGYDSQILENDVISAGQKQLITIARGMIENAPFLILDEATSNVDTRTEELVQNAMDILTKGKTSFIIAHRLSTIKNADLILVINEGNIIEQGNHEELMKQNGFYADLYNSQFEL